MTKHLVLTVFLLSVVLVAGCTASPPQVIRETVEVEATVTVEREVVVTATPTSPPQGGVFVQALGSNPTILNPILAADPPSFSVISLVFPRLVGQDPFSGAAAPAEMAEGWEISGDGLVWTFHLRQGVTWTDGEPVDGADFKYTYDAIASDAVNSPRKSYLTGVESIETPDPYTVIITFNQVTCDALLKNFWVPWLPSHLYAQDFSDISEYDEAPPVSAGAFIFEDWVPGDHVSLVRNPDYWKGAPFMDGVIFKVVPDPGARLAQLQAGEVDLITAQLDQLTSITLDPSLRLYTSELDGYDFIALNLANPDNPQPAFGETGELVTQEPHPVLGDVNLRRAIAYSLDYDAILSTVYRGQGYRLASNVLPAVAWAYDSSIEPYPYDPQMATQLLEDAGWTDSNRDGIREKDGHRLALTLTADAGNSLFQDLAVLIQEHLGRVGFDITVETLEYGTLVGTLLNQTYDMVIMKLEGLGADPNDSVLWSRSYDIPGAGFNFTSYQNPDLEQLLQSALSVPGCTTTGRAPLYHRVQQIIHDDVPVIFISGSIGNAGYTSRWRGIAPGPWSLVHNIHEWYLQP